MKTIRASQRGFGLISLLIALTIGVFLLAGLFDLWLQTRNTFNAQGSLAQLQDNERIALTLMSSITQSAGYYPLTENYVTPANPTPPSIPFTAANVFVAGDNAAGTFSAGQFVIGTGAAADTTTSDTLAVRFMSDGNAGAGENANASNLDCQGQIQPDRTLVTNLYQIDNQGNLTCTVITTTTAGATNTTNPQPIVTGISVMKVLYGVDPTGTESSPSEYMDAATVAANTQWTNVRSIKVTLTFKNPLAPLTGPAVAGQPATLPPISQIVAVTQTTNVI
jgi:type IV pilus assembly protein PilW